MEAASRADAERQLKERDAELAQRTSEYSAARARVRQLEKDLKERGQYRRSKSNSQSTHDRYAQEIASMLEDYDISEAASLLAAALVKLEKKHSVDLKQQLLDTKPLAKAMHDRDEKTVGVIAKNIRENIFTPEKFAMLRLVVNNSLRECELMHQTFKHEHFEDGTKKRYRLHPDHKEPFPELFAIADIK